MKGLRSVDVFVSGQNGYCGFRIPVLEAAADGSLLAFAEARKNNFGDPGTGHNTIDLVWKRSTDGGTTWSPMAVIEAPGEQWSAGKGRNCIVWAGPKGPGRANLVVRLSHDDAKTFPDERPVAKGPAAYTDLALLPGNGMGVLWERDEYRFITFTRLDPEFFNPRRHRNTKEPV